MRKYIFYMIPEHHINLLTLHLFFVFSKTIVIGSHLVLVICCCYIYIQNTDKTIVMQLLYCRKLALHFIDLYSLPAPSPPIVYLGQNCVKIKERTSKINI